MVSERWSPIKGYDLAYEVSNQGRVRRARSRRILRLFSVAGKQETLCVDLRKDGAARRHSVAALVAATFLPAPKQSDMRAGHRSEDVTDNRVTNLVWLTPAEYASRRFQRLAQSRGVDGCFNGVEANG